MHGLINRSIEQFVRDTYGQGIWIEVMNELDFGFPEFEMMLVYEDAVTEQLIGELTRQLARPRSDFLEDVGTFLVANRKLERVRRLLRFGGETFVEFLHSLDDLPARARLAVPELILPDMKLTEISGQKYRLSVEPVGQSQLKFGHVITGLLRTMADDYGALVMLEYLNGTQSGEVIEIRLLDACFAAGRTFELGAMGID